MNGKPRPSQQAITIDPSRRVNSPTETKVLLFDEAKQCYYETTISFICSAVLREVRKAFAEQDAKLDANIKAQNEDFDNRMKAVEDKITKFIDDTSQVNQALINMVDSHSN